MIVPTRLTGLTVHLRVEALEARSPASSLLDLAYLGLTAAEEPFADPPVGSPLIGLRPGLLVEDGFDRPHTWAVTTDAGKMADSQPASVPAQSTERSGRLEIDALADQRPASSPSLVWQPAPQMTARLFTDFAEGLGVTTVAPSHTGPMATPPIGVGPRVPSVAVEVSWPPAALGPVAQTYGGGYTAPTSTGYVVGMKVQEVDFIGDVVVKADPGREPYPSESGRPEWRDDNLDGVINDNWDADKKPTEWSVPVTVVKNTCPTVSAKFNWLGQNLLGMRIAPGRLAC